jgi:hypothetical protein
MKFEWHNDFLKGANVLKSSPLLNYRARNIKSPVHLRRGALRKDSIQTNFILFMCGNANQYLSNKRGFTGTQK